LDKKEDLANKLEALAEKIRLNFSLRDSNREKALLLCREIIRNSAKTIRAVHRREFKEAKQLLQSASILTNKLNLIISANQNELVHSGFVHDAEKEFAEASITFSIIKSHKIPTPEQLGVNYPAYLNGMGESVGEIRRFLLDSLRQNDFSRCEDLLSIMDDIYTLLVTMDFPDAITYGLRRNTDSVRGILEKTRGDLTLAQQQKELEKRIESMTSKPNSANIRKLF
jgi:translin